MMISGRNLSVLADCVKIELSRCLLVRKLENFNLIHIIMGTSTEKQESVSNKSYNLHSEAVKNVNKLWQTRQPDTSSSINLVSEINLVVKNDVSQTDIETEFRCPSYTENSLLIATWNNHMHSLEKQLNEKQVVIETLFTIVLITTTLLLTTIIFEDINSPQAESKYIKLLRNQIRFIVTGNLPPHRPPPPWNCPPDNWPRQIPSWVRDRIMVRVRVGAIFRGAVFQGAIFRVPRFMTTKFHVIMAIRKQLVNQRINILKLSIKVLSKVIQLFFPFP